MKMRNSAYKVWPKCRTMCGCAVPFVFLVMTLALLANVTAEESQTHLERSPRVSEDGRSIVPPLINCSAGLMRGKIINLTDGGKVIAYLGIPYALPPVGELRFKPPEPVPRWDDVYNATSFGPLCVQSKSRSHWDIIMAPDSKKLLKRLGLFDYPQGEDCLNLNIYVPWPLPETYDRKNLSVMFFIHGGSYKTNGGRFYPGEWLAHAGGVIVITMNYRLGVLGFLSTHDHAAEGNYGLLDQVLAMKWLKRNIGFFGGNPDDITIFGNSAGGSCVGMHLMSPLSKGLFSKAIAQSGSPIGEWAFQKRPRMYVEQLAQKLNCSEMNTTEGMVNCLKNISAYDIVQKSEDATLEDSLIIQFAPVVDDNFLPKHPLDLLRQEDAVAQVPVMVGITTDELEVWMTKSYQDRDPSSIPFTKDLLRKYLKHLIRKESLPERTLDVLLHAVYTEYVFRHGATSPHHKKKTQLKLSRNHSSGAFYDRITSALPDIRTLGKIISDIDLKAPAVKLLQLLGLRRNMSLYMYEFDYASEDDVIFNKQEANNNDWAGAYHESELYYIFGYPHLNLHNALRGYDDKQIADMMVQLWSNFAKYGNPTPTGTRKVQPLQNFMWTQYTEDEESFASLSVDPFVARSYEKERMVFWNHFVPLLTDYPITWSPIKTEAKTIVAKLLEECRFEIILALGFLGWVTCILCLGVSLHVCLCRSLNLFRMKNLPIPI